MKGDMDTINRETEYPEILENNNVKPENNIYKNVKISNQTDDISYIEKIIKGYDEEFTLPKNWNDLTENKKYEYLSELSRKHFSKIPNSLIPLAVGYMHPNPPVETFDEIPEWLDREKFARGQRFACINFFGISLVEVLSVFIIFTFEDGLDPIISTGGSSEPYTAFLRFLSTANRVRNWLTSDPWTKGTAAYKDIRVVKKMHQNVRDKLSQLTNKELDEASTIDNAWSPARDILIEDLKSLCPAAGPTQCPYALKFHDVRPRPLNPGLMACAQFEFIGLIVLFPEALGIHSSTDEDLEAYCHVWKGLGYLLGIEDKFNFCQGSLEEIKQRSSDYINLWLKPNLRVFTPEYEHMVRCAVAGVNYFFQPNLPYESLLLYVLELIDLDMPKFKSSMSYNAKIRHNVIKFVINYGCRLSGVRNYLNKRINSSLDHASKFSKEKHIELREKSAKRMSEVLKNKKNTNDEIGDDKSSINATKYSQHKIMGIFIVITQCLILWGVTSIYRIYFK